MEKYREDHIQKHIKPYSYQEEMVKIILNKENDIRNFIINLETGKGKTYTSVMIIKKLLNENSENKFVFLVENVALADQQSKYIENFNLDTLKIVGGKNKITSRKKFDQIKNDFNVMVIVGEIFYRCLSRGYFTLKDFKMIIFDECHHCDQGHHYNKIMRDFIF